MPTAAARLRLHVLPALRALRHRNFRLFFTGEAVSISGYWMQHVAMNWLVYAITDSSAHLGMIDFAVQIPILLLAGMTGVLMEGKNLRNVILLCQSFSMFHALLLSVLVLTGTVEFWHLLALAFLMGISDSFEIPARQAFVSQLIDDPNDLGNGIALNQTVFNVTRLAGPSLAGFIIAWTGEGICFLINAVSYAGTLAALLKMKFSRPFDPPANSRNGTTLRDSLRQGIDYAVRFPPIGTALTGMALISFFGFPAITFMPVFARDILGGKPQILGFLSAALGAGALAGSAWLATRGSPAGLARDMGYAAAGLGVSVVFFCLSRSLLLSLVLISAVGFCLSVTVISCSTTVQILVESEKRSRVMSLQVMATMGITPVGSLATGWLAGFLGTTIILACWGGICALVGVWLLKIYPRIRAYSLPVLEAKGIRDPH